MQFTIGRQKLLTALKNIQVVVPNHVVIPASAGFLFEIDHGNDLKISCTDATHSASCLTEVDNTDGGFRLIIPAHRLMTALSLCTGDEISVSNKQWTGRVEVTDGHVMFKLATISADMPKLNLDYTDRNCVCTVEEGWLLKSMTGVEFAAAKTEAQGSVSGLSCVCIQTKKGEVSIIAGSGISMARMTGPGGTAESKTSVPLPSMRIIRGLLKQRETDCSIYKVDSRLVIKTEDLLFSIPMHSAQFPEVSRFFSRIEDATSQTTVVTDEFLSGLHGAMVVDSAVDVDPTSVTLESVAEELRMSAETSAGSYAGVIPADRKGGNAKVMLQCQKLIRACNLCEESVTLHMSQPSSPVYIVSGGFIMVIMPIGKAKS